MACGAPPPAVGTTRRSVVLRAAVAAAFAPVPPRVFASGRAVPDAETDRRGYEAALAMLKLAASWGDQPYGAVVVAGGAVIGHGPSRVVQRGDPAAHAEREALRDAQRVLGRPDLAGATLYSTSRPCRMCEAAAAEANVARMVYGSELRDAGAPKR